MQWFVDNKEWFFSGFGVFAASAIAAIFFKNKSESKQIQKSGRNSVNYQAGGDINMEIKDGK
ncbi:hypothetical protein D9M71_812160 [compost metagenome]